MKLGKTILAGALVLFFVAAAWGAEKKRDIIILKDGSEKRVDKVEDENYASVTFSLGGRTSKMKASRVKEVHYYDAPQDYRNARGYMNSKKYKDAIDAFEKASSTSGVRPWVKVYAFFNIAECYRLLGAIDSANYDSAVENYDNLLKEAPLSRFLPAALYYKGDSLKRAKKYSKASAAFQKLITEVGTKSLEERWGRLADIAQAGVKEAQGLYDEAFVKYTTIYTLTRNTHPTIANMALLRKGMCLLKQKKFREAKKYFKDLEKSAKGEGAMAREIKAGASIGRGHCFLNEKKYLEARHWFLQAMVVHFSDEFGPEAMYHAALCYEKLKGKEIGTGEHAKWIFSDLISRYPNSEWSKKAVKKGYKDLKHE